MIGSGGAGLTAAISSAEEGCSVTVLSKTATGAASATSYSSGFFTFPDEDLSAGEYRDLVRGVGKNLSREDLLEALGEQARDCLLQLRSWGATLRFLGGGHATVIDSGWFVDREALVFRQERWCARAGHQAQATDPLDHGAGCRAGRRDGIADDDQQGGTQQRGFALPEGDQGGAFFGGEGNVLGLKGQTVQAERLGTTRRDVFLGGRVIAFEDDDWRLAGVGFALGFERRNRRLRRRRVAAGLVGQGKGGAEQMV